MPRVYGIEVANGGLVRNARCLMHAQVAICCIGVLFFIAGVVRYFTAKNTIKDWLDRSGETDLQDSTSVDVSAIINAAAAMLLPLLLIMLVRNAIRNNSRDVLTGVCVFEGVCSVCAAVGVVNAMMAVPLYFHVGQQIEQYDCSASANPASCESARDPANALLTLTIVFAIVQLVLGLCQTIACISGTTEANKAGQALQRGEVFTGPPKIPVMANVTLGQPTSRVEHNTVVVGIPV